jgi:hypothetical protein
LEGQGNVSVDGKIISKPLNQLLRAREICLYSRTFIVKTVFSKLILILQYRTLIS